MKKSINISLEFDEKGYFDRQCPDEKCLYKFKILGSDYDEKLREDSLYCPQCGCQEASNMWNTEEQNEKINEIITNYGLNLLHKKMNKTFNDLEKSTRRNKNVKIKYKPTKINKFFNLPIPALEEYVSEIKCEKCGVSYSVIGIAYYCPSCGINPITNLFDHEFKKIKDKINNIDNITKYFLDINDKDSAYNLERDLIESSIGDIISIYQKLLYMVFIDKTSKEVRVNDFQILDKSYILYKESIGIDIFQNINEEEKLEAEVMFQIRHILEHNNGFIDVKFVKKINDSKYVNNQRIVVRKQDVLRFYDIIDKITKIVIKIEKGE